LKTFFTIFILILNYTILIGYDDISWVNDQIEAIKPVRKGISNQKINLIKDPFVFLDNNKTKTNKTKQKKVFFPPAQHMIIQQKQTVNFKLYAIMNNSAFINKKWCKVGEKIQGYKLIKVKYNEVTLKRGKKVITLTTRSKKSHIENRIIK